MWKRQTSSDWLNTETINHWMQCNVMFLSSFGKNYSFKNDLLINLKEVNRIKRLITNQWMKWMLGNFLGKIFTDLHKTISSDWWLSSLISGIFFLKKFSGKQNWTNSSRLYTILVKNKIRFLSFFSFFPKKILSEIL